MLAILVVSFGALLAERNQKLAGEVRRWLGRATTPVASAVTPIEAREIPVEPVAPRHAR